MAGNGSFAVLQNENTSNSRRDGFTMVLQKEIQRFYFGTRMEGI